MTLTEEQLKLIKEIQEGEKILKDFMKLTPPNMRQKRLAQRYIDECTMIIDNKKMRVLLLEQFNKQENNQATN